MLMVKMKAGFLFQNTFVGTDTGMKPFAENSSFSPMFSSSQNTHNYKAILLTARYSIHDYSCFTNTKGLIRRTTVFLLFTFAFLLSTAQTFTTNIAQSTIGKNQYAEVSYEMGNATSIDNFQVPQYKDWIVVSGPMSSSYQSNINGQVSQRTTMTYYLQPMRSGRLTVEGATATLNGKPIHSDSRTVQVLDKNVATPPAGSNSAQQADPFGNLLNDPFFAQPPAMQVAPQQDEFIDAIVLRPGESTAEKIQKNLFIKVIPSKTTCYEGEPIMVTYKVYTRLDVDNASVTRRPSFSGFSAYDMEEPNQPFEMDELNGKRYHSWSIRKVQLYPLQSGQLTLDPVEVDFNIRFAKGDMVANHTYDPYSQNSFTSVQYTLKSPAISITALPLPAAGKPANFSGAVGSFSIRSSVDDAAPGKDDAVHLKVEIRGTGHFSMVRPPAVKWPATTEAYDPKETENLNKSDMPISGSKVFDYVFLPHQTGPYTIQPISFSYFDVAAKTYKTVATQPISLQVSNVSKHPILPTSSEQGQNWPVVFSRLAAYVLPALAAVLLGILLFSSSSSKKKKQQEKAKAHAERSAWENLLQEAKIKKAATTTTQQSANTFSVNEPPPDQNHDAYLPVGLVQQPIPESAAPELVASAQIALPQAETLVWNDDHQLFYKALKNDVIRALGTITNQTTTSKTELLQTLRAGGIEEEVVQQISALADECDAALYSPLSTATNRQKMLEEARFLLEKVQAGQ